MRYWSLLLCVVLLTSLARAESAYKAQYGWGLAKQIATPSLTQGMVIDQNQIIIAETAGLERRDLNGNNPKLLLEQTGIRGLQGAGSGANLALAWYGRDVVNPSGLWWRYQNKTVFALDTPYNTFALLEVGGLPVLVGVTQQGSLTGVVVQPWGKEPETIFQTKLNIGALAANSVDGKIGIAFAEGYRNPQDEKYDLRFLELPSLGSGAVRSRILAPAVYLGREQRYGMAVKDGSLLPIWWYETKEEQNLAAFTKQHNPRLAFFEADKVVEFAPPTAYIGQIGKSLYYALNNQIYAYDLESKQSRVEITAPTSFSFAAVSQNRQMAWQSLQRDGFTSQLWFVDSSLAYKPNLIDEVSKTLGWNPWFPFQNLFGQTALSLMLATLAVVLVAPVVWLLRGRFDFGQGAWFGAGIAVFLLLLVRFLGGNVIATGWVFAPLLTASWLVVLGGIGVGGLVVFFQRHRLNQIELGATIAASLVVLIGTFFTVFSRIGFLKF